MKKCLLGLFVIMLFSCSQSDVAIKYNLPAPVSMELYHNGYYSSFDGKDELVGTISSNFTKAIYSQSGDFLSYEREYLSDASKGYHKNSMPLELSWRIPFLSVQSVEGQVNRVQSVRGYEKFIPDVVEKLPIKKHFKNQLRNQRFQLEFDRYEKRRWELGHLIGSKKVPTKGDITAELSNQGRLPIPMLEVDSVISTGFRKLDKRRCFVYNVYYREREPFPYFMWEQHAYGIENAAALREFKPDSGSYYTHYSMAIDPKTGIPCQEREVKHGTIFVSNEKTKEKDEIKVNITLENLYNIDQL
ncbi:MAG: hypothetical protein GX801_02060 [Fibrobacter sp.]|nr:hypothetical protein [Fibrobacter sp.]